MRTQTCVNRLVTFASSDETVATVDAAGLLTPLRTGAAVVTATAASGVSASCTVIVIGEAQTVLTLPAALTSVGPEAFAGAAADVYALPAAVTSIGARAFADLSRAALVRIPAAGAVTIAEDAFEGSSVVIECLPGSPVESWAQARGIPTVNPQ